jgi:hypothetical protein
MRHSLFIVCLLSQMALAEAGQTNTTAPGAQGAVVVVNPTPSPSSPNSGFNKVNPSNVQVFDNDFFKDTPKAQFNSVTPKGRAYADEPDYNTETRQRALDKCEPLRSQNFAKYQECYQKDMANVKKGIQDNYDEVERKQNVPLKNAPNPLIEEQMRNPSGVREED